MKINSISLNLRSSFPSQEQIERPQKGCEFGVEWVASVRG